MPWWSYLILAVVALPILGLFTRYGLRRRMDRMTRRHYREMSTEDAEIARAVAKISQDIDRGRGASRGFF